MANIAELERVLTFITDHPEQHKQGSWTCATGACFAGHAALLNGYQKYFLDGVAVNGEVIKDHRHYDVEYEAIKILGLRQTDAVILFSGSNTRDSIAEMIKDLANGEPLGRWWSLDKTEDRLGGLVSAVWRRCEEPLRCPPSC